MCLNECVFKLLLFMKHRNYSYNFFFQKYEWYIFHKRNVIPSWDDTQTSPPTILQVYFTATVQLQLPVRGDSLPCLVFLQCDHGLKWRSHTQAWGRQRPNTYFTSWTHSLCKQFCCPVHSELGLQEYIFLTCCQVSHAGLQLMVVAKLPVSHCLHLTDCVFKKNWNHLQQIIGMVFWAPRNI